jgi:hypothetical protein
MSVEKILEERGSQYGEFSILAYLSHNLKKEIKEMGGYNNMLPYQKEALDMIIHKIARICNGNPNYIDSWKDISGYATLVVKYLEEKQ